MRLADLWIRLASVTRLRLVASSGPGSSPAWTRRGVGWVAGTVPEPGVLLWEERGTWSEAGGPPTPFHNRLRWTCDRAAHALALHHLRRGVARPVHLASFTVTGGGGISAGGPHLCGPDAYFPRLHVTRAGFSLTWEVRGPAKRYTVLARYT